MNRHDDGELIRTCPRHRDYVVPLISTFRFPGVEHWCPYCGWTTWSFFSDHSNRTPATDELVTRLAVYEQAAKPFLQSIRGVGTQIEWEENVRAEDLPPIPDDPDRPMVACDGCGKSAPARIIAGRFGNEYAKPGHWYQRGRGDTLKTACSRACVDVVTKRDGGDGMVLPW